MGETQTCSILYCEGRHYKLAITSVDGASSSVKAVTKQLAAYARTIVTEANSADGRYTPASYIYTGFADESALNSYISQSGYSSDTSLLEIGEHGRSGRKGGRGRASPLTNIPCADSCFPCRLLQPPPSS